MNRIWTCGCCGKQFDTLPLDVAYKAPQHWFGLPEAEREHCAKLDDDVCVIDGKEIFVRGCLEIPIIGQADRFVWGVWASVSEASFARISELWEAPVIENEPPKFGWLCNTLPLYPPTLLLKTHLHLRGAPNRPTIELEPTDHPLAVEQRQGISLERVEEIAAALSLWH